MEPKLLNKINDNNANNSSEPLKLVENVISKFNKKYLNLSKELNNFQYEFMDQMNLLMDSINKKNFKINHQNSFQTHKVSTSVKSPHHKSPNKIKVNNSTEYMLKKNDNSTSDINSKINIKKNSNTLRKNQKLNFENKNDGYLSSSIDNLSKELIFIYGKKNNCLTQKNSKKLFSKKDPTYKPIISSSSLIVNQKKENYFFTRPKMTNEEIKRNSDIIKSLKICANSEIFNFKEKVQIKFLNKTLKKEINLFNIYKNIIDEDYSNNPEDYPSKSIQFGLNFITKEINDNLIQSNTSEIKKYLELIFIILNVSNYYMNNSSSVDLFNFIFKQFNCSNIKELFFDVIFKNIFRNKNYNKHIIIPFLDKFIDLNKDDFNASSFIYLSLKEIFEFFFSQYLCYPKSKNI